MAFLPRCPPPLLPPRSHEQAPRMPRLLPFLNLSPQGVIYIHHTYIHTCKHTYIHVDVCVCVCVCVCVYPFHHLSTQGMCMYVLVPTNVSVWVFACVSLHAGILCISDALNDTCVRVCVYVCILCVSDALYPHRRVCACVCILCVSDALYPHRHVCVRVYLVYI